MLHAEVASENRRATRQSARYDTHWSRLFSNAIPARLGEVISKVVIERTARTWIRALERIPVMWKRSLHVGSNWRILAD